MKREAAALLDKSMASLRRAIGAFNAMDDDGRRTAVLLFAQHSAEMLVKAGLVERDVKVMDKRSGRSIGFESCLNLAGEHLGLDGDQTGQLRSIDALRDDEQHWLGGLEEELLYIELRSTVAVIDGLLDRVFDQKLADHLPDRALPITTRPVQDFDVLVDKQFSQVNELLETGKRRRVEARAKIRGLLALEGHATDDARVSERDVDRVEKAIKAGKPVEEVFPRLRTLTAAVTVDGPTVSVSMVKKGGAPVTYVPADDPSATAVREVDLQRKYHWPPRELAGKVGLTGPKAYALRRHIGIDDDPACVHTFTFESQRIVRYSDNAFKKMRDALEGGVDMQAVWEEHKPGKNAA